MKILVRLSFVSSLLLMLAIIASAQEGPTRAELDCLMLANSSRVAVPGNPSLSIAYHHIWTPNMNYGSFQSNGLNLFYEKEGNGSEVIIVVHGGPGLPHEYFHPLLSNLSRYATLIYFDRRADMLSARSSFEVASLSEMADDVEALRLALGQDRVTLLGHSFGGAIALTYALRHPDKVKRMILVSTAATIENPLEAEKRILQALTPAESAAYYSNESGSAPGSSCDRVRKRYRALYPHYFHKQPDARMLEGGVYSVYFDALAKKMALANNAGGVDLRAMLDRIKIPTLVFAGRHDIVTPLSQTTEMADGLPHSKLVVMQHSAHFPFFEENYLFTEWVRRFLLDRESVVESMPGTPVVTGSSQSQ